MNGIICANNRECFENPATSTSSSHSELNISSTCRLIVREIVVLWKKPRIQ